MRSCRVSIINRIPRCFRQKTFAAFPTFAALSFIAKAARRRSAQHSLTFLVRTPHWESYFLVLVLGTLMFGSILAAADVSKLPYWACNMMWYMAPMLFLTWSRKLSQSLPSHCSTVHGKCHFAPPYSNCPSRSGAMGAQGNIRVTPCVTSLERLVLSACFLSLAPCRLDEGSDHREYFEQVLMRLKMPASKDSLSGLVCIASEAAGYVHEAARCQELDPADNSKPSTHGIERYPLSCHPHPKIRSRSASIQPCLGLVLGWGVGMGGGTFDAYDLPFLRPCTRTNPPSIREPLSISNQSRSFHADDCLQETWHLLS